MANKTPSTYTPVTDHGELTKVLDNVYIVRGSFNLGLGIMIGRTMTIVKRGDDLTVINSIRVNEEVEAEIKKLGTIKHLVRLCTGHGTDDAYFINTFEPTYWSLEGIAPVADTKAHDKALTEDGERPIPDMKLVLFKNTPLKKWHECVIWIPDSDGTLITCDFIQNQTTTDHTSFMGKHISYWMGFQGECKCSPMWRSANGMDHWDDIERILAWDFENLVAAHGGAKIGGAKAATEKNLKATWKKE
jgi:hypothetical protein